MKKKTLFLSALMLMLCTLSSHAQWGLGISGGWDYNTPAINKGFATDVIYKGRGGYNVAIVGRYQFLDWVAVRADLKVSSRCYQMNRNYQDISDIYTRHRDTYLHLPIMADLSLGGSKLRGHVYLGGYAGYWLNAHRSGNTLQCSTEIQGLEEKYVGYDESMTFDSNRDKRFNAGLIGGLGISYRINKNWEVMVEGFYMYDLTKSNKTSEIVSIPRYNSTADINIGVMYNF